VKVGILKCNSYQKLRNDIGKKCAKVKKSANFWNFFTSFVGAEGSKFDKIGFLENFLVFQLNLFTIQK